MSLPTLFKLDSSGTRRQWRIWTSGHTVIKEYGVEGGKLIRNDRVCKVTKKESAEDRAITTAQRDWVKQLDKGYRADEKDKPGTRLVNKTLKDKALKGGTNHGVTGIGKVKVTARDSVKDFKVPGADLSRRPMPAATKLFNKTKTCLKYFDFGNDVAYVQPKFDGFRVMCYIHDGKVVMITRRGKQYPWFKHIREAVLEYLKKDDRIDARGLILDGELYTHDLRGDDGKVLSPTEKFSLIQSICGLKRTEPHPRERELKFMVFDVADPNSPQNHRIEILEYLDKRYKGKVIEMAATHCVGRLDQVYALYGDMVDQGYEGVIIRSSRNEYKFGTRTQYMKKLKPDKDAEFKIVGYYSGNGSHEGCCMWTCVTENGEEFGVTPKGPLDYRRRLFDECEQGMHMGRMLTVLYQDESETGVPRFGRGKAFRDE